MSLSKTQRKKLVSALVANARSAMFAAIEIHNKPVFEYRYEVCVLLVINAWELALKAYIAKELPHVRLHKKKDGTSKPFLKCLSCASSELGKPFEAARLNLEALYEYRNKVAHFYSENLGIVVLGLLKTSVIFFSKFLEAHFSEKLSETANLILLPIGFNKPMSPIDFLSNESSTKEASKEVKAFLESIKKSSETLQKQGIDDSIIVNYSISLMNESRIKNADLIAAINNDLPQKNNITVYNLISSASLTNDPNAKAVRLSEESVFADLFTEGYYDVVAAAEKRFSDFKMNNEFHALMKTIKENPNLARKRLMNPKKPNGQSQMFYSKATIDELAKHYMTRRTA